METHDLTTKMTAKIPKIVSTCESSVSFGNSPEARRASPSLGASKPRPPGKVAFDNSLVYLNLHARSSFWRANPETLRERNRFPFRPAVLTNFQFTFPIPAARDILGNMLRGATK